MGVTPTGFTRPTVQEILSDIQTDQLAEIGPNWDISTDTPEGQINGIFANQLGLAWEVLEAAYHAFDPDKADDDRLTNLSKLTGTERRAASKGLVTLTVEADIGTVLLNAAAFANVSGEDDNRWTPQDDFTAPSTGFHPVVFEAENTGPIAALAVSITVISTPITGWSSVSNPNDASVGRVLDADPTLRERREEQLTATGSSTKDAIEADLLELNDIETAKVLENDTDSVDANGLPPHSFEALIYDGSPPAADDDAIAQIIWDSKPAGIQPRGSVTGDAIDRNADTQIVAFTRVSVVEIWIEITIVTSAGYVGDSAVEAYIVTECNTKFGSAGLDVVALFVQALPIDLEGVDDVTAFTIGTSASPTLSVNVPISPREISRFDTARITVTTV